MMEEENPSIPPAETPEAELEFRPWVKWAALGLAGAGSLGLFLLTYYVGYGQGQESGFQQAVRSGLVEESLNAAASQNVLNFMRLASASDAHLQQAAANTDAAFGWIQDATVRQEAEWSLACALLERRMADSALAVLRPLMQAVPHTAEWGYRALKAADALAGIQQFESARDYYNLADSIFSENKLDEARLTTLGQLMSLEMTIPQAAETAVAALNALQEKLKSEARGAQLLRSMAQVHQGILYRGLGKAQDAESCFRKALEQGTPAEFAVPEARACFGSALLELGDAAAAEPLLREAANANGTRTSDIAARLQALRQLAIIENQRGHNVTALALLHRAQGVADGRIPDNNTFWPSLFDQRDWMHYQVQNYQTALLDFTAAINSTQDAQLLMQPQEGAARCYLELAKADQAQPLLQNCLKLRNQFAPEDKPALGRINLLLGQIYDQQGKVTEAEAAYAQAVANLPGNTPEEIANRRAALFGHAYALGELKRWAEAYAAWEQVLPLVEEQFDRREEVRSQMRRIKPLIPAAPAAEEPAQAPQ